MSRTILLLFGVIIGAQAIPAPQFTPCKSDDSVCLTKTSNTIYKLSVAGDPELNIESLEPMFHESMIGDLGVIKYNLRNTTVEGFKDCDVVDTKVELEKLKIQLDLVCPHFKMYGLYQISGQLFTMPIEGDGDYIIQFKDYYVNIDSEVKIEQKDGKKYMSIKSYKVNADLRGGMVADLKNLFNGQKELGDNLLNFANQNWKPVATLLQGPAFDANSKKLVKNFNKYLKTVPLDQLLLK